VAFGVLQKKKKTTHTLLIFTFAEDVYKAKSANKGGSMTPDSDADVSNSTIRESRKYGGCVNNNGMMFLHGDPSTGFGVIRESRHRYEHKASLSFFTKIEIGDNYKKHYTNN
jgi:hypothetical protein